MKPNEPKQAVVTIIYKGDKVLCVRKPSSEHTDISGKWVFPGCLLDNHQDIRAALKSIVKKEIFYGEEIGKVLYTKHKDFDVNLHFYPCITFSDIELCKEHSYSEIKWAEAHDLMEEENWPEYYHDILLRIKSINQHLCSTVTYNLWEQYNHRYQCCREPVAQYKKDSNYIRNILVAYCNNRTMFEQVVDDGEYRIVSDYKAQSSPIDVDCIMLHYPEFGYRMFSVNSIRIEPSVSGSRCVLAYKIAEERTNVLISSIVAEQIKSSADTRPFILSFENA